MLMVATRIVRLGGVPVDVEILDADGGISFGEHPRDADVLRDDQRLVPSV